jgi:hypothetical protein
MTAAAQTARDLLRRLADGCCPIHGIGMTQTGLTNDETAFVCACPRKDCGITGFTHSPHGPVSLAPAWSHIVAPGGWMG